MILDKKIDAIINVPKQVTQLINSDLLHPNNYIMKWNRAIPYVDNTLKNINICSDLYNEFYQRSTMIKISPLDISLENI